MGVAGANMQWGCFVCPSCCQKSESTAFVLVLQSFLVPVSKLLEVVLYVIKGDNFASQDIWSRAASVGNGKNYEKHAQFSRG